MKQTAVEFIVEKLTPFNWTKEQMQEHYKDAIEQAKAMEKEQREKDFVEGYKTRALASNLIFDEKSEYYAKTLFNRTYKTE